MKKPPLTLVGQPKPTLNPPPASLGEAGAKLWQSIQSDVVIDDSSGQWRDHIDAVVVKLRK